MELFKDVNGVVFAYDDEQLEMGLADDKVKLTQAEVAAHMAPYKHTYDEIMNLRRMAYADPLVGSDRWFAEATRLTIMGAGADEVEVAKASGVSRYAEIQLEYPWP